MGEERDAEALGQLVDVHDVVPVVVGEQDVRDLGALAIDPLEQRIGDAVRVDEHALATGLVDDEIGV